MQLGGKSCFEAFHAALDCFGQKMQANYCFYLGLVAVCLLSQAVHGQEADTETTLETGWRAFNSGYNLIKLCQTFKRHAELQHRALRPWCCRHTGICTSISYRYINAMWDLNNNAHCFLQGLWQLQQGRMISRLLRMTGPAGLFSKSLSAMTSASASKYSLCWESVITLELGLLDPPDVVCGVTAGPWGRLIGMTMMLPLTASWKLSGRAGAVHWETG